MSSFEDLRKELKSLLQAIGHTLDDVFENVAISRFSMPAE